MVELAQSPQTSNPPKSGGRKKIYIIVGILAGLAIISAGFFLWTDWVKDRLAQRRELLVESATDPASLTTDQFRDLLKQIYDKYPSKKIGGLPMIKNINLTYQQEKVTSGATTKPPQPDIQIDPIENQEPDLRWPVFSFGIWYTNPDDASDPDKKADADAKLANIKSLVEEYYPIVAEIFGEPYDVENRNITFDLYLAPDQGPSYIEFFDIVIVAGDQPQDVVPSLILAFWGKYCEFIPETWVYGIGYRVADLAIREATGSHDLTMEEWRGNYEKYNIKDYPIAGASINYETDIFGSNVSREFLAAAAFSKTDMYDQEFYKKLNQKFYEIPFESTDWLDEMKIFARVSSVFPVIEGQQPDVWYGKQHVLHQTETNPQVLASMGVITQTFMVKNDTTGKIEVYAFLLSPASGTFSCGNRPVNGSKFDPKVVTNNLDIEDDKGSVINQKNVTTNNNGLGQFTESDVGISVTGGRYLIKITGSPQEKASFDYFTTGVPADLHGAIKNFGQGIVEAFYKEDNRRITRAMVERGAFKFGLSMEGILILKVYDSSGNELLVKELSKDVGTYDAFLHSPQPSFPPAPSRGRGGEECADIDTSDWETYGGGEYTINYPETWFSEEEGPAEGTQLSWFVSFGPKDLAPLVYVGGYPQDFAEFKKYLEAELNYDIQAEDTETISGSQATRLTVQIQSGSYPEYYYYIPLGNIPTVIRGPKESETFTECEAQIFEKMLETYQYKGMGP